MEQKELTGVFAAVDQVVDKWSRRAIYAEGIAEAAREELRARRHVEDDLERFRDALARADAHSVKVVAELAAQRAHADGLAESLNKAGHAISDLMCALSNDRPYDEVFVAWHAALPFAFGNQPAHDPPPIAGDLARARLAELEAQRAVWEADAGLLKAQQADLTLVHAHTRDLQARHDQVEDAWRAAAEEVHFGSETDAVCDGPPAILRDDAVAWRAQAEKTIAAGLAGNGILRERLEDLESQAARLSALDFVRRGLDLLAALHALRDDEAAPCAEMTLGFDAGAAAAIGFDRAVVGLVRPGQKTFTELYREQSEALRAAEQACVEAELRESNARLSAADNAVRTRLVDRLAIVEAGWRESHEAEALANNDAAVATQRANELVAEVLATAIERNRYHAALLKIQRFDDQGFGQERLQHIRTTYREALAPRQGMPINPPMGSVPAKESK